MIALSRLIGQTSGAALVALCFGLGGLSMMVSGVPVGANSAAHWANCSG